MTSAGTLREFAWIWFGCIVSPRRNQLFQIFIIRPSL